MGCGRRSFVSRLTLLCALALAAGRGDGKEDPALARLLEEIVEKHCPYAAYLERGKDIFSGFGVLVGEEFYVLTSDNVSQGTTDVHVWFRRTKSSRYKAKILRADSRAGVAVLQIDDPSFRLDKRRAKALEKAGTVAKGDCVLSLGHLTAYQRWQLLPGAVDNPEHLDHTADAMPYVCHTGDLLGGHYGGPLLRVELKQGRLECREGKLSITGLERGKPEIAKVEIVGVNAKWWKNQEGARFGLALRSDALIERVHQLVNDDS